MKHQAFGLTDPGRAREHNEDAILLDEELGVYVVCDGVSGRSAGQTASALACRLVHKALKSGAGFLHRCAADPTLPNRAAAKRLLEEAIQDASREIHSAAQQDAEKSGMSTTIAMLVMAGDYAFVAHVGDSRVYLLRDGHPRLLTDDHTLGNLYVKKGLTSREKARKDPSVQGLIRAVGPQEAVLPEVLSVELMPSDSFLLCSDGLHHYLRNQDMVNLWGSLPAEEIPKALVALANQRGGEDNISAVVVKVAPEARPGADLLRLKLETLKKTPLFENLGFRDLMKVLDIATVLRADAGQVVIKEGDVGDRMYVIMTGQAEVYKSGRSIAMLPAASFFGEMCFVDKSPRSATVAAVGAALLLAIDRKDFVALLRSEEAVATKVLIGLCQLLVQRLRRTGDELSQVKGKLEEISPADLAAGYLAPDAQEDDGTL